MQQNLHKSLRDSTERLRAILSACSTEFIALRCARLFSQRRTPDLELMSPQRQITFLLGLMLTSREPDESTELQENDWRECLRLLEVTFQSYAKMYFPSAEETKRINDEWLKVRDVAAHSFLLYFNSGLLASTPQVKDRLRLYVVPFDDAVKEHFGIGASEMLLVADAVATMIQQQWDGLKDAKEEEQLNRQEFLDKAQQEGWDVQRMRKETTDSAYGRSAHNLIGSLNSLHKIRLPDLESILEPKIARGFWRIFTARRGEGAPLTYPTEANVADDKSLYLLNRDEAVAPSVQGMYTSALSVVERHLANSDTRDNYFAHRDITLEDHCVRLCGKFYDSDAQVVRSVFETPDRQNEHDLIVRWRDSVFVIEAKASPPREPLRDPDRAYIRIRDDFRSDTGIQKAYDQARRIERQFQSGKPVILYDRSGQPVLEFSTKTVNRVYCICVTRDDYGMLATDLSLLLQKDPGAAFPWAVNILDLENIINAWLYFGWGPEKLRDYLDLREKLHGRAVADDELDIAGCYIMHGSLRWLVGDDEKRILLDASYSLIFDDIFYATRGGKPVVITPKPPAILNVGDEIAKLTASSSSETVGTSLRSHKPGRNDPCICGSGKKYKRCCGR